MEMYLAELVLIKVGNILTTAMVVPAGLPIDEVIREVTEALGLDSGLVNTWTHPIAVSHMPENAEESRALGKNALLKLEALEDVPPEIAEFLKDKRRELIEAN